jgi:hypothetical protein
VPFRLYSFSDDGRCFRNQPAEIDTACEHVGEPFIRTMETIQGESARAGVHRSIYPWAALAVAAIAVTGFARTYYLKSLFAGPPLPAMVHVHGVVMTLWCVLFIAQTCLVAGHRVDLHRRLGVFGVALAIVVVGLGTYATLAATASQVHRHVIGRFHFLLGFNLVNLRLFAALVGTGISFRRWPEFHKRLMLLATVTLLAPAIARITLLFTHSGTAQMLAFDFCVATCVIVDTIRHRRLHPAFGWGGLIILLFLHLTFAAVQTNAWLSLVPRLFA